MVYYDDILNVNAYLRSNIRKNMDDTQKLLDKYRKLDAERDLLQRQSDAVFFEAQQLANDMGLDITDIVSEPLCKERREISSCSELLIEIPDDFDFSAAFGKLAEEAHRAGFTDVHPEDLLTAGEMKHAEDFSNALDERFKAETGLTSKDYEILMISVAIHVFCHYLTPFLPEEKEITDADILKENISLLTDRVGIFPEIRQESQILSGYIPFDLPDNKLFSRDDILGFHPQLGWLIGVINILTDSVTTKNMESFSVIPSLYQSQSPEIGQKIPTFFHLVVPILRNLPDNKEAVLAAVVREAGVLNKFNLPIDDISYLMQNTLGIEKTVGSICKSDDAALPLTAFMNRLITALHAVRFDPDTDGNIQMYAIRTGKILAITRGIVAFINSIPAVISGDLTQLDFNGIAAACLTAFSQARFWVEVKANYLVSEYKIEIDKQMRILDNYIKVTSKKI